MITHRNFFLIIGISLVTQVIPGAVMGTAETFICVIAVVEQQTHHHLVPQAVLQSRGKHCVTHHGKVTNDVCLSGQKQLHNLPSPPPGRSVGGPGQVSCVQQHFDA